MLRTKALGSAVGIQHQGVQDFSEPDSGGQAGTVGVVAGYFKRGKLTPFPVTANDYRARLGYEPNNKFFVAIQDLFKTGQPVVWIQRLVPSNEVG